MDNNIIESYTGVQENGKKSKVPAKLDLLLTISGVFLALFMIGHMLFVSSILISKDAMATITNFFELSFLINGGTGILVQTVGIVVFIAFFVHAFLALRRYPSSRNRYVKMKTHKDMMQHKDTTLWYIQASTGIFLMFSVVFHLYTMISQPQNIGPNASSYRVYENSLWLFYIALLLFVELHASIGLYRAVLKWGLINGKKARAKIMIFKNFISAFFIILGLMTLYAYYTIGKDNSENGVVGKYKAEQKLVILEVM